MKLSMLVELWSVWRCDPSGGRPKGDISESMKRTELRLYDDSKNRWMVGTREDGRLQELYIQDIPKPWIVQARYKRRNAEMAPRVSSPPLHLDLIAPPQ
jgi:hypothetical protein